MNMKTWTNPSVEELDVKLTALLEWTDDSEYPNGVFDGNMIFGGDEGSSGSGSSNEGGNNGDNGNNGGNTGVQGGFGTAS